MQKQINISLHKKAKPWVRHNNESARLPEQAKEIYTNKLRETLWDNRFHLEKMDEYNRGPRKLTFREKLKLDIHIKPIVEHPQTDRLLDRLMRKSIRQQKLPELKFRDTEPKDDSDKSLKIDKQVPVFELKLNLKKIWEEASIPNFHRNIFLQGLEMNSLKKARKYIIREIKSIKNKKALVILTRRSILARQNCITRLKKQVAESKTPQINYADLDQKVKRIIKDYQQLTLLTIENIINWRAPLQKLFSADKSNYYHISFDFQNQDYLLKIPHDNKDITNWLGLHQSDIFLIGLKLKTVSTIRVRASQLMLIEESLVSDINGKTSLRLK